MLISMTGFGRAGGVVRNHQIKVELKSVNSKFTEYRFRLPPFLKDKEFEIRKLLSAGIDRGKIEFFVEQINGDQHEVQINRALFIKYAATLKELIAEAQINADGLVASILNLPEVVESPEVTIDDTDWEATEGIILKAIDEFNAFRLHEGKILSEVIKQNVVMIKQYLEEISPYESVRIGQLKTRLLRTLSDYSNRPEYDANRFEQELLYYLEKMDFTEEKVRLDKHCNFFLEKLNLPVSNGRELNFISQEMGREINTLGSKAQDHNIQHLVVAMKDELEKIKEQLANVV